MRKEALKLGAAILLCSVFLFNPGRVAGDWWDNDWKFRRMISITGSHPENFHIKLTVLSDDDMRADYYDLRFLENESSGVLPFWIAESSPSDAVVWVKRAENIDGSIYMYYGNPVAGKVDNWENTILPYVDSQILSAAPWTGRLDFASVVFDDKIWILGGYDGTSNLNDVWCSSDGMNWTQVTNNADWSPRRGHAAVVFDGKMWVLGGVDSSVWYSTDGENWIQAAASAGWSARWGFGLVVHENRMWVLGGYDGTYLNDVWYSENGAVWTLVTSSAPWSGRHSHAVVFYENRIWLFGGYSLGSYESDVWSVENAENADNWVLVTGNASWTPRRDHTAVVFDNRLWIIGGSGEAWKEYLGDVWYSVDGASWISATSSGGWSARYGHCSVLFNDRIFMFGGYDGAVRRDVWGLLRTYVSPEPVVSIGEEEPFPPTLISPAKNASLNDNTPTFRWENLSTVDNWEIWVDNDPSFASPTLVENTFENWFIPTYELSDENYYWRVRAWGPWGPSDFSGVSVFLVDTVPPDNPPLAWVAPDRGYDDPVDNTTMNSQDTYFEWGLVSDNSNSPTGEIAGMRCYEVIIDNDPTPPYVCSENTSDADDYSLIIYGLPEGNWRWWVRAWDWAGNYTDSECWYLNIDLTAYPPDPVNPENETYTSSTMITFDWSDGYDPTGVRKYWLWVDNVPDPSQSPSSPNYLEITFLAEAGSKYTYIFSTPADEKYYWRVKLKDYAGDDAGVGEGNWSSWSDTFWFIVDTTPPLKPENLLSPENNLITSDRTPFFEWSTAEDNVELTTDVAGVENYLLQIDDDPNFSSPFEFMVHGNNQYTLPDAYPLDEGVWYWRVCAVDRAGNLGGWSGVMSFRVSIPRPPAKAPTFLTITPSTFESYSGGSTSLTAILCDASGNPLQGKYITWSATVGNLSATYTTTDNSGLATMTFRAPVVKDEFFVTVTATFAGDATYDGCTATATGRILPTPAISTELSITSPALLLGSGENLGLYAVLRENGAPLGEVVVSWSAKLGYLFQTQTETDLLGQASVLYSAPEVETTTLEKITVTFAGDAEHLPSAASLDLMILPAEKKQTLDALKESLKSVATGLGIRLENEMLEELENAFASEFLGAVLTLRFEFGMAEAVSDYKHEGVATKVVDLKPGEQIVIEISSRENDKSLMINFPDVILPAETMEKVLVDGLEIEKAESFADALNPADDDDCEYWVVVGENGGQVLVSIPEFSSRTIVIIALRAPVGTWLLAVFAIVALALGILAWFLKELSGERREAQQRTLRGHSALDFELRLTTSCPLFQRP